jgi:hypothetical protein
MFALGYADALEPQHRLLRDSPLGVQDLWIGPQFVGPAAETRITALHHEYRIGDRRRRGLAAQGQAASRLEAGFDLAEQSRQVDGLGVEIRAADLDAFGAIRRQRVRGQCDHWDRRGFRSGLDQ